MDEPRRDLDGLTIRRLTEQPDALGESPVWDSLTECLWRVDSMAGSLHRLDWSSGKVTSFRFSEHLGALGLAHDGKILVAGRHQIRLFAPERDAQSVILDLPDLPDMRLNDAKMDRQGRFLCAGMHLRKQPSALLHQIDSAGQYRVIARNIRVGNGICFSPAGDILYFADTAARKFYACDYDPQTGTASEPRLHIDTTALETGIDGATVDAEGSIWAALIRRGQIGCFSASGRLQDVIAAPTDLPSSLCFGGPKMQHLFVTSIKSSGKGRLESAHPDGGKLLVIEGMGITGIPEARFAYMRSESSQ